MFVTQDLIQPQNSDLQIRENENGVYMAGVSEREVASMDDCLNLLHVGDRNRFQQPLFARVAACKFALLACKDLCLKPCLSRLAMAQRKMFSGQACTASAGRNLGCRGQA